MYPAAGRRRASSKSRAFCCSREGRGRMPDPSLYLITRGLAFAQLASANILRIALVAKTVVAHRRDVLLHDIDAHVVVLGEASAEIARTLAAWIVEVAAEISVVVVAHRHW